MNKLCILVLFNIILFLLLIYTQKCNTMQTGGEEDKMDINTFMDDTKAWCSTNYDNIVKMTQAYSLCKKSGAEEYNSNTGVVNSGEEVSDILYK